ncbi:circularly permuted type 2 ATP-grasp protein [Geopsychrobacter electrodiphilus]|uniref:circularly permuted type 2 ATP-grasp protein n=1 Tax=Geopsychrobacter electrodiphilus TaxID=225196 RepID=UPI0003A8608C|nr:circularly permuted type 2 ATP-grasp protein [Geopsychrobacter electrodiphilus]
MRIESDQRQNAGSQSYATELSQDTDFCLSKGILSAHEQKLMQSLETIGSKRLNRRRKEAQRLLRENGATHNVFDTIDRAHPWQFDPVPLIISDEEWGKIEAGLVQRATLLNLILADIYGPQTLTEKGLLPPELIFAHQGFLLPCVGMLSSEKRHLNIYSANLTRGKDGRFWVLEDRTQPPLGSGYALENRIVMTRSFPRLFQDFQVHRLAMYYRALRNNLSQLALHNKAEPHIVALTPGPGHSAYFEHAYLASYLGYTLVQGGDLVVRDGCVWLKSVGGLRQVDVILRRLDDNWCDPLELRGDSMFGVPGLLEAIRLGNVVTANHIGSNVLENPALLAFLPGISRHLLQEELLLPSVATWWCGQPREREFVLQNLNKLMVKPIHPISGLPEFIPGSLDEIQLSSWRKRILANPHLYVGQELACLSTVPSFVSDKIEQRQSILSTFLTAQDQTYVAMPGGLTRIAPQASGEIFSNQERGISKDTWVLTREPEKQVNLWRKAQPNQLIQPIVGSLPSRAAENLFWAGRYAERTEATARLLRAILTKILEYNEFRDADDHQRLNHLLGALTHLTSTFPGFIGEGADEKLADPRAELLSLAREIERPGSLRASLRGLSRATYAIRDLLPADAWLVVDNMRQNWNPKIAVSQIGSGQLNASVNKLILQLSAFSGLTHENMSRETAWLLLNIGRRLERAINLITLLRATLVPCYEASMESQMIESVLETCNSLIVFRRRYRSFMQLSTILELLLLDENYPRALAYQLQQLQSHIDALPREQLIEGPGQDKKMISEAITELRNANHTQLTQLAGSDSTYPLLEKLLVSQKDRLEQLLEALTQLYFSPVLVPQQLGNNVEGKKAS